MEEIPAIGGGAYHGEPGMAGYVFDDSFTLGPVASERGPAGSGIISYGKYEQDHFGGELPRKVTDPRWDEWVAARENWWEDWAKDTVAFIRQVDKNPAHQIYLEDPADDVLHPDRTKTIGLDLAEGRQALRCLRRLLGLRVPRLSR